MQNYRIIKFINWIENFLVIIVENLIRFVILNQQKNNRIMHIEQFE